MAEGKPLGYSNVSGFTSHWFGCRWLVLNNRVYDVQDFRSDNPTVMDVLQKFTGKDASHMINTSFPYLLPLIEHYLVGNYCLPEPEAAVGGNLEYMYTCSMLLDCERNLAFLLGNSIYGYYG